MTDPVTRFKSNMDRLVYSQSNVSQALDVSVMTLNNWRKDGIIFGHVWEKRGQVLFSGRGVLHTVIINELAWAIGPTKAKKIAESFVDRHESFDTDLKGYRLIVHKPIGGDYLVNGVDAEKSEPEGGMFFHLAPFDTPYLYPDSQLHVPLHRKFLDAAYGVQLRLDAENA